MLVLKILFGIGIIATLILGCKLYVFGDYDYYDNDLGDNILINVLYAISVSLFLGIISGYWCYICFSKPEVSVLKKVIVTIIPIVFMIVVHFWRCDTRNSWMYYVFCFIRISYCCIF